MELKCALAFFISVVVSKIATRAMIRVAKKFGIVDVPDPKRPQKIHKKKTPLLGGVGVFLGFFTALLVIAGYQQEILLLLVGGTTILILGMMDDISPLSAAKKLTVQAVVALLWAVLGIRIGWFQHPVAAVVISLFWFVGITNSLNLMDNIDGATAGISLIASIFYLLVGMFQGNVLLAVGSAALAGSCFIFLKYNLIKRPAVIFLGDCGSLFLGCALAWLTMIGVWRTSFSVNLAMIPPLILAVPIFDTSLATILRIKNKKPIYLADRSNLTYRLLEFIPKEKVVIVQYSIGALTGASAILLLWLTPIFAFVIFITIFASLTILGVRLSIPGKMTSAEEAVLKTDDVVLPSAELKRQVKYKIGEIKEDSSSTAPKPHVTEVQRNPV